MHGVVSKRFHLLQPKVCPPRLDRISIITDVQDLRELDFIIDDHPSSEPLALDFETCGAEPASSECYPVGVAFADSRGSCYVDLLSCPGAYEYLMRRLYEARTPLLCHNVFFDAAWPLRDFGLWLNYLACTLAVYRLTASEGEWGQKWGLKSAQIDQLGWTETNEDGLDRWLIDNGYHQSVAKEQKEGYYFYPEWLVGGKPSPEGRWVSPNKAEMWRAPPDILGHYAALDADSTWLLWTEVLKPCVDRFTFLREYVYEWYPPYLEVLVRQKLRGMHVNRDGIEAYLVDVRADFEAQVEAFLARPEIAPFVEQVNAEAVAEEKAREPEKFLKKKLGKEPPRWKKDGSESINWAKWKVKADTPPVVSKNWEKWEVRYRDVCLSTHFNLNSPVQVRTLLYDFLKLPVEVYTKPSKTSPDGMPSTGKTALLGMGDIGAALLAIKDREKIRQFCEQLLSLLQPHEDGTWTVHPGFSVPGTLTGRLSGREPNIQQVPKDGNFLRHFIPRPGYIFVDCDHTAVEPVVMTELSKCPGLRKIYGPEAKPNCVYLYAGSFFPNEIGEKILAAGYDRDGMSEEALERIKKACKPQRVPSKRFKLAYDYGAGTDKLQFGFKMDGYLFPREGVQQARDSMDVAFPGLGPWGKELERQWKKNKGWIFNGLGRPLAVSQEKLKDLKNRVAQSTGHDIHIKYILIVMGLLNEAGIEWHPAIVDFHDQMIVECRVEDAERVKWIMGTEAYVHLNEWLDGEIKVKGDPQIVKNLAYAKVEKWAEKEEEEELSAEETEFIKARA